jgi:hypothetical protein
MIFAFWPGHRSVPDLVQVEVEVGEKAVDRVRGKRRERGEREKEEKGV